MCRSSCGDKNYIMVDSYSEGEERVEEDITHCNGIGSWELEGRERVATL